MTHFGVLRIRLFMAAITGRHLGPFTHGPPTGHLAISPRAVHIAMRRDGKDAPGLIIDDHDSILLWALLQRLAQVA